MRHSADRSACGALPRSKNRRTGPAREDPLIELVVSALADVLLDIQTEVKPKKSEAMLSPCARGSLESCRMVFSTDRSVFFIVCMGDQCSASENMRF